jgi:hypothetical protein
VQYVERAPAEVAMAALNGQVLGSGAIRISWGRSTSRAPVLRDPALSAAAAGGGAPLGVAVGAYPAAALAGGGMMAYAGGGMVRRGWRLGGCVVGWSGVGGHQQH